MIDILSYAGNPDGSVSKTIQTSVANLIPELTALQAQLANFKLGQQTSDILSAIQNYTDQINKLQIIAPPQQAPPIPPINNFPQGAAKVVIIKPVKG